MPQITAGQNIADSSQINPGVVQASDLASDAVETAKIKDAAVTAGKIASDAVETAKIKDAAVTKEKIAGAAEIEDSKLAQITTAGKVSGAAITLLTSVPAGAGLLPAVNTPAPGMSDGAVEVRTANTDRNTAATSYTKLKEIRLGMFGGTVTVSFGLYTADGSYIAYGRIYKNGVAVGTERSTSFSYEQTYTEQLTGLATNDLIQLYAKTNNASYVAHVLNFKILAASAEVSVVVTD